MIAFLGLSDTGEGALIAVGGGIAELRQVIAVGLARREEGF